MVDREKEARLLEPVERIATDPEKDSPEEGIALCLSGGGYRAMLFHLGSLWRLNEVAYLKKCARISSVSGGSITAATLGSRWSSLAFDGQGVAQNFVDEVVPPLRALADRTIDVTSVLAGSLGPGSIADKITKAYRKHLFGNQTLQDLPDEPRFVINASNVQSGALWRFMKPYMRDWKVGEVKNPTIELAVAVAASSAFPPFLSPLEMELEDSDFTPNTGGLQRPPFTTDVILTDGGVYDNLGLETAWKKYKTILVSDAGGALEPESEPKRDWARHTYRVLLLIDNQVRSLRTRQVIDSFDAKVREGTYWSIRSNIQKYSASKPLNCPLEKTSRLANVATRLKRLDNHTQEALINWGYAIADVAVRTFVDRNLPQPTSFPYPDVGVG